MSRHSFSQLSTPRVATRCGQAAMNEIGLDVADLQAIWRSVLIPTAGGSRRALLFAKVSVVKPERPARPSVPVDLMPHLRHALDLMDRNYAESVDLDLLAAAAGVSKYHFLRCFAATYGQTPAQHLCQRRIERAQDLLRATNLTVTEICHLVGFSSLGSFSSRFHELVGAWPSEYQARYAARGNPRIPGCYVFMHGLSDRKRADQKSAILKKRTTENSPYG